MRSSAFHLATAKETPADAEIVSHQLMIRTGMIRKLSSGIYSWSPLGLKVLRKVEQIVREEMDRAGCLEMLMPCIQPAELWQETGRWDVFGPLLLKINDRAGRDFCFGPTHEEVITDFVRAEIRSYKQLPISLYQIQTKFRDEIRPRFGVMRAREFTMKDAYSFHLDDASMSDTYQRMHQAYCRIFERMDLAYRPVEADSGAIGGSESHEFQVLADSGEDAIVYSTDSSYAANIETAEAQSPPPSSAESLEMEWVDTPNQRTIAEVCAHLNVRSDEMVKTLIIETREGELVAVCLRGDHELNEVKASRQALIGEGWQLASDEKVLKACTTPVGYLGPWNLNLSIIVDRAAAALDAFVCGANDPGKHLKGVSWAGVNLDRDDDPVVIADLRNVVEGDPSPDGKGTLKIARGIEVGHIFKLGTKYSESMNALVQNEDGKSVPMIMGCYGIGVSRIVAAAIEQNHDDRGIIWPLALAPFSVVIVPLNGHKSPRVTEAAETLYTQLLAKGVEVLLDDRKLRPGVMFADAELLGIPHRVVIGEKALDQNQFEYRKRTAADNDMIDQSTAVDFLLGQLADH